MALMMGHVWETLHPGFPDGGLSCGVVGSVCMILLTVEFTSCKADFFLKNTHPHAYAKCSLGIVSKMILRSRWMAKGRYHLRMRMWSSWWLRKSRDTTYP